MCISGQFSAFLGFVICNGQIAHLVSDHFALTSNLTIEIDWTKFLQLNENKSHQSIITLDSFADLHLRYFQTENETIDKCLVRAATNKRKSKVEFECKCFDRAGTYQIIIEEPLTFEAISLRTVNVFWPMVHVYLPETYSALSGNGVNVKFRRRLGCTPNEQSSEHFSTVQIWRAESAETVKTTVKLKKFYKEQTIPVNRWWTLNSLALPCKYFSRPGFYKIVLLRSVNSSGSLDVISESNIMRVNFSTDYYKLKTISGSIFPCPTSGIAVTFEKVACDSLSQRIRLWGVLINETSKSKHNKYIGEENVSPSKSVVNFGCNYFDLIYLEYCFQHAAVFDDGTVIELGRQCVSTQKTNCKLTFSVFIFYFLFEICIDKTILLFCLKC